ncbi:MAG: FAD-dependent oxidoreductase, partial [Bacillota bacterium]
ALEDGTLCTETFDLVVLAVGLNPPAGIRELAEAARVELDQYGFCASSEFAPGCTTRPGIYAGGVFRGPKDIPETVMEASAAACAAAQLLSDVRGTATKKIEFPPERDVTGQKPRIGVFVCNCGINIAGTINVAKLVAYASRLKDVVHVQEFLFTCSQDSITQIKSAILEHNLNRVVVASCTPRTHAPLFQSVMRETGLNPYLYEHVNIREHSSWVHRNYPEAATAKARELIKMAVAKVKLLSPITPSASAVNPGALVVGGGAAGLTAALALAGQGFKVTLVEKTNLLGGHLNHLYYTIYGNNPKDLLTNLKAEIQSNPLIEVLLETRIIDTRGYPGNYRTKLSVAGIEREIEHGATIIATGAGEYRPREYLYGSDPRVVTQKEFEARLARGETPNDVVMIQCVGSRDEERPYCSRICCLTAIKNALRLKELNPRANIYVLYREMRTYGLTEEFYTRARMAGVIFIRYEPEKKPAVESLPDGLEITAFDPILQKNLILKADLLVLSAGIVPAEDNNRLSQLFKVPLNSDGFFLEAHLKLRPVDFAADGLYLCGLAHSPKLLEESLAQAYAAAMRAATLLSKEHLENVAIVSTTDQEICVGCGICIQVCDYQARLLNEETGKAEVVEALCQGCGACVAACPSGAAGQKGFEKSQLLAMLDAAMG